MVAFAKGKTSSITELMAVPTGFPIGGLYVIDSITGANLAPARAYGEMPKRFKDEAAAEKYIQTLGSQPWTEAMFKAAVEALVVGRYGATPSADGWAYELQTPAGALSVRADDNWIACRFSDEKLAAKVVCEGGLNRHNGKWNWHGYDHDRQQTVYEFASALKNLVGEAWHISKHKRVPVAGKPMRSTQGSLFDAAQERSTAT